MFALVGWHAASVTQGDSRPYMARMSASCTGYFNRPHDTKPRYLPQSPRGCRLEVAEVLCRTTSTSGEVSPAEGVGDGYRRERGGWGC
jgi:hypothetical protein